MRNVTGRCHYVNQLAACILGMTCHKAKNKVSLNGIEFGKQIGKIITLCTILCIGVDVLPQQGNILVTALDKFANLRHDLFFFATAFATAHVRHDAVRTEIVTPVHDRDPRTVIAFATNGKILNHRVFGFFGAIDALTRLQLLTKQLRQAVQGRGPHDEIDVRIAEFDIVLTVLLCHHTTANGNDECRILLFEMLVLPHDRERSFFGVLANGAGVDHDKIGKGRVCDNSVPHLLTHTGKLFAIRLVLLTAKCLHKRAATFARGFKHTVIFGTHRIYILLLLCRRKRRHRSVFLH